MKNVIEEHHTQYVPYRILAREEYLSSIKERRNTKINIDDLIEIKRFICKKTRILQGWDIRGLTMLQIENINRWMPVWSPSEILLLRMHYGKTCQNIHTIINERFGVSKRNISKAS